MGGALALLQGQAAGRGAGPAGESREVLVLVVDDAPDIRGLLTVLLEQVGYRVVTAASGEEALAVAADRSPDLVVLDVVLPGIDGFETCRRLKAEQGESMPVLMLSGRGRRAVVEGLEAGADDFVQKPFEPDEFWARVAALLRVHAAETAARRRAERLLSLQRVSAAVAARLDEAEVVRLVLDETQHLLDVDGAVLFLWDPAAGVLRPYQAIVVPAGVVPTPRRPGEGVTGQAFTQARPVWVNDYAGWDQATGDSRAAGASAAVAAPLLLGNEVLGVIGARKLAPGARVEEEDAQLLGLLAGLAAAALNNARMYASQRDAAFRAAERAAQLEAVMESMADGVLVIDRTGGLTGANRAAAELLGVPRERLVGSRDGEAMPPLRDLEGSSVTWAARLTEVLREGRALVDQELVTVVDGQERVLTHTTGPIRDSDDSIVGAIAVFRDVTERRRLAERQSQADKLRALGQMASGVAHDVNNLLATVLGRAELARLELERGVLDQQRIAEALRLIEQAAEDGAQTVRRIQEFARVRRDTEHAVVDLGAVARGAAELTRPRWRDAAQAAGRTVELRLELEPELFVAAQAAELREVLTNLIFNAVDAMSAGGTIVIRGQRDGPTVRLAVSDSGVGMSPDVCRRVFEPFFSTKREAGTGLGLAVSYGIVQRHGGQIAVESTPGEGTTFTIELPLADRRPAAPPAAAGKGPTGRRILVVDDEPALASVLQRLLESEGHVVTPCTGGVEALERFDPVAHELVMTDLGMADLNGLQLAAALHARSPATPVILVTGWGNELDPDHPPPGISRVLAKPYRLAAVLEAIATALADESASTAG